MALFTPVMSKERSKARNGVNLTKRNQPLVASLSRLIHSRIYGGQLSILTPFSSWIAKSFTASPSTKWTSLRSRVNAVIPPSSRVLSVLTWSPVRPPLTHKTTRSPPTVWLRILQFTVNVSATSCLRLASLESKPLATCNLPKRIREKISDGSWMLRIVRILRILRIQQS